MTLQYYGKYFTYASNSIKSLNYAEVILKTLAKYEFNLSIIPKVL